MPSSRFQDPHSIGLIGFGAFGQLAARHLAPYFDVLAYDPAAEAGPIDPETGARLVDLATAAACPCIVLAVPVAALRSAIDAIFPFLQPDAMVIDVGSVKCGPVETMRDRLPAGVDIIGTHPLFGPQSARGGLKGLQIAVCPVRGRRLGVSLLSCAGGWRCASS